MAKNDKNTQEPKIKGENVDRKDSTRHADEAARQQAIAKMKEAQARQKTTEAAETQESSGSAGDVDEQREVKSSEIDPKAKKALTELLGSDKKQKTGELEQVKVYSPFRIYYDSPASSVSAVNGTGPFDVLPGHRNFLTLLSQGDIVVRSVTGKEETISIDRGVMHVHGDNVKVFLDV